MVAFAAGAAGGLTCIKIPVRSASALPRSTFLSSPNRFLPRDQQACSRHPASNDTRTLTTALFKSFGRKTQKPTVKKYETVVIPTSYGLPAALFGLTGMAALADAKVPGTVFFLLGALLAVQATLIRFRFDDEAFEVIFGSGDVTTNPVLGDNRWRYDSFTNWEFWWPNFPVLVYYKETQTRESGQPHFFPIICDGKLLYKLFVERCGPSQNSGPNDQTTL